MRFELTLPCGKHAFQECMSTNELLDYLWDILVIQN